MRAPGFSYGHIMYAPRQHEITAVQKSDNKSLNLGCGAFKLGYSFTSRLILL